MRKMQFMLLAPPGMSGSPVFSIVGLTSDVAGSGSVTLPINPSPALSGLVLRFQWVMLDPVLQIITADGIELTIK